MTRRLALALLGLLLLQGCSAWRGATATRPAQAGAQASTATPMAATNAALSDFASARSSEISSARRTLDEIVQATARQPPARQVRPRGIVTAPFEVTDKQSAQTRSVETFDSLTVDLPLALRGSPEHDAAMAGVKALAETLAKSRGSAEIVRAFAPADVRNEKIVLESAAAKSASGQDILVRRQSDPEVLRGFERIIVRGAALPHRL